MYLKAVIHHLLWRSTNKVQNHYHKTVSQSFVTFRAVSWRYAERICFVVSALGITKGSRGSRKWIVNCGLSWCILFVSRVFCFLWAKKFKVIFKTTFWWSLSSEQCMLSCLKSKTLSGFWMISYPRSVHTALICNNFYFKNRKRL